MGQLFATANTKLFIGPAKAYTGTAFTAGDFPTEGENAIAWTRIGGTTDLGQLGRTTTMVESPQIDGNDPGNTAIIRKRKAVRRPGTMTIVCDNDPTDAGQVALIAAENSSRDSFAFKIEFDDAPAGGTPSTRFFVAYVIDNPEQFNDANSAIKLNATLEIDGNIVRVAAAEAEV